MRLVGGVAAVIGHHLGGDAVIWQLRCGYYAAVPRLVGDEDFTTDFHGIGHGFSQDCVYLCFVCDNLCFVVVDKRVTISLSEISRRL